MFKGVGDKMIVFIRNCDLKKSGLLETERGLIKRFLVMRAILIAFLVGWGFFLVSSCATVPTGPLTEGEVRLLSIEVPGSEAIRFTVEFKIDLTFESDGNPEIKRACLYWSGDGPYCYFVKNIEYGPPGKIQIWSRVPALSKAGSYRLECNLEYLHNGKPRISNMLGSSVYLKY